MVATTLLPAMFAACASNPARRRAEIITNSDRQAKQALAAENKIDVSKIPPRAFAVTPFVVATRDTLLTPLGFGLADLLTTDLARSPRLQLVERLHTDAILHELDLVDAGVTDPRGAPRVGRLVGARRILIGTLSSGADGTVHLDVRVVDVISGTVQQVAAADAPLERIIDAEKALALLLFERLGITLTPAERTLVEQRQTTQLAALVAYGKGVDAEAHGDAGAAMTAYQDAARLDAAFAAARAQASGSGASQQSRASGVQRVLELSTTALNSPVAAHIPEAADAPLAASLTIGLVITIKVSP
jgi:TolB-like protein